MTIYNCMFKKLNTSLKLYLLENKMISSHKRHISTKGLSHFFEVLNTNCTLHFY